MRFLFFYLMADDPRVGEVAPRHAAYWHDLALPDYLGGPFADRSGGLITFEADSPDEAERLVSGDPFLHEHTIRTWRLEPWLAEGAVTR